MAVILPAATVTRDCLLLFGSFACKSSFWLLGLLRFANIMTTFPVFCSFWMILLGYLTMNYRVLVRDTCRVNHRVRHTYQTICIRAVWMHCSETLNAFLGVNLCLERHRAAFNHGIHSFVRYLISLLSGQTYDCANLLRILLKQELSVGIMGTMVVNIVIHVVTYVQQHVRGNPIWLCYLIRFKLNYLRCWVLRLIDWNNGQILLKSRFFKLPLLFNKLLEH